MTVLPALGIAMLVVLLLVIPAIVIWRDLRVGRPDPTFHDAEG